MTRTATRADGPLVLVGTGAGVTLIPSPTRLTRLNYFDGKFLRADDLRAEQDYLRSLVQLSNQAGGAGVVHGFDASLGATGTLELGPGLAIDRAGRVLLLPHGTSVGISELIARSRARTGSASGAGANGAAGFAGCAEATTVTPPVSTVLPTDLYLVVLAHAEAFCGEEDVYGKLCEDACSTSTDRRYRVEGVTLLAVPVSLDAPSCTSASLTRRHHRSQAASAYFATERARLGREMSAARLKTDLWCHGARIEHWPAEAGDGVPVALVSVSGSSVEWLDAWIARRERMEAPAARYWAWQMAMRPREVFLAQVLQFQCHLHDVLAGGPPETGGGDPCTRRYRLLERAKEVLDRLEAVDGHGEDRPEHLPELKALREEILVALDEDVPGPSRVLIDRGIVELPPAGYLPVLPGREVNEQVRRLMGEGVDLRFCVVRPDYVPHALEEAQHLDRICLLHGLENAAGRPQVDVLVPDGEIVETAPPPAGHLFEVTLRTPTPQKGNTKPGARGEEEASAGEGRALLRGAGRARPLPGGGGAFHFAGIGVLSGITEVPSPGYKENLRHSMGAQEADPTRGGKGFRVPELPDLGDALGRLLRNLAGARAAGGDEQSFRSTAREEIADTRPGGQEEATVGVWASVRCEADPFSLDVGEAAPVRGELLAAVDGLSFQRQPVSGSAEVRLVADLVCRVPAEGGSRMTGILQGWAFVRASSSLGTGDSGEETPTRLDVPVELALTPQAGGGAALAATVLLGNGRTRLAVTVTTAWRGRPLLARSVAAFDILRTAEDMRSRTTDPAVRKELDEYIASMKAGRIPATQDLLVADARENPAVANPGNPYHADAVRALKAIEKVREEPGFREASERLLFPPPPKPVSGKTVRATRDWVLFHRRRTSSCDCCTGTAVAAPSRRYRVYHARAGANTTVEEIRAVLTGTRPIRDGLEMVPVTVEFEGGGANLLTGRGVVLDAWRSAGPADALLYGAVVGAGEGTGDPDSLLDARLDRLVSVVDDVTPEAPGAVFDVLGRLPPGVSSGTADGVIVLVTVPRERVTECHEFFRVHLNSDRQALLKEFLTGGSSRDELLAFAEPLGKVHFAAGSASAVEGLDAVVERWWEEGGIALTSAIVLSDDGDDRAESRVRQADAVVRKLGSDVSPSHVPSSAKLSECPAVTLLLGREQDTRVARFVTHMGREGNRHSHSTDARLQFRFDAEGQIQSWSQFDTAINGLRAYLPHSPIAVTFATREGYDTDLAQKSLDTVYDELAKRGMLTSGPAGNPAASKALTKLAEYERYLLSADGIQADDIVLLQLD